MIVGWRSKGQPEWSGVLQCQNCAKWRLHYGIRVKRWFTLFFIPVVPLWGDSKVICAVCLHEEKPDRQAYEELGQTAKRNLQLAEANGGKLPASPTSLGSAEPAT